MARIVSQQFNKNPLGPFRRESSSFLERIDVPSVQNPLILFFTLNPPQGRETMKNRKGIAVEAWSEDGFRSTTPRILAFTGFFFSFSFSSFLRSCSTLPSTLLALCTANYWLRQLSVARTMVDFRVRLIGSVCRRETFVSLSKRTTQRLHAWERVVNLKCPRDRANHRFLNHRVPSRFVN